MPLAERPGTVPRRIGNESQEKYASMLFQYCDITLRWSLTKTKDIELCTPDLLTQMARIRCCLM